MKGINLLSSSKILIQNVMKDEEHLAVPWDMHKKELRSHALGDEVSFSCAVLLHVGAEEGVFFRLPPLTLLHRTPTVCGYADEREQRWSCCLLLENGIDREKKERII